MVWRYCPDCEEWRETSGGYEPQGREGYLACTECGTAVHGYADTPEPPARPPRDRPSSVHYDGDE